jgi:ribosomal protein L7/L12
MPLVKENNMHTEIEYQGKVWKTKQTFNKTIQECANVFYENLNQIDKFQFELEDGSICVFGKNIIQNCIMRFVESEPKFKYWELLVKEPIQNKLDAIRELRIITNSSLKEAKDVIDFASSGRIVKIESAIKMTEAEINNTPLRSYFKIKYCITES